MNGKCYHLHGLGKLAPGRGETGSVWRRKKYARSGVALISYGKMSGPTSRRIGAIIRVRRKSTLHNCAKPSRTSKNRSPQTASPPSVPRRHSIEHFIALKKD